MLVKWEAQALFFFTHKYDFNLCKRIFLWKKWPKLFRFRKKKPNQQFLMISSIDLAKNIEGFSFFNSIFIC
jgi:hypothetical protein